MGKENNDNKQNEPQVERARIHAVTNLDIALANPAEQVLREHQHSMIESLRNAFAAGATAGYMSEPTGAGKTAAMLKAVEAIGLKTLILSPTQQILHQIRNDADRFTPGLAITDYYGDSKDLSGQVINTTNHSGFNLVQAAKLHQERGEPYGFDPKSIELVFVDEVHMALGEVRHTIFREFPNALMVGMTATPHFSQLEGYISRGLIPEDERWLGLFQNNIHEMTIEEAMEREIITGADIYTFNTEIEIGNIPANTRGDYRKADLEHYFNTLTRNSLTLAMLAGEKGLSPQVELTPGKLAEVEEIHNKIKGKPTLVFVTSVNHSEQIARALRDMDITAEAFHGELASDTRNEIYEQYLNGNIQVLAGVDAMSTGFDAPLTQVGIFARPTMSATLKLQQFGRTLRPSPETGKDRAIAIDFSDRMKYRSQAPILLPQVFDPEYVLRGSTSGRARKKSVSHRTDSPKQWPVTFSGARVDLIIQEAKAQELLQRRFKQADIYETAEALTMVITSIQEQNPETTLYQFYQKVYQNLPEKIPSEAYEQSVQAIASLDTNTKKLGREVFLWLNLKTAMGLVDAYATVNDSDEEKDELLQIALLAIDDITSTLNPKHAVAGQVHIAIRKSLTDYIANRDHVPKKVAWELNYPKAVSKVLEVVPDLQYMTSGKERSETIHMLSEEVGLAEEIILEILESQDQIEQDLLISAGDPVGEAILPGALNRDLIKSMEELSEKERDILLKHYGFESAEPITLEDIAKEYHVTSERIRQIESKALRKMRKPSRSNRFKAYAYEIGGGVVRESYPQYQDQYQGDVYPPVDPDNYFHSPDALKHKFPTMGSFFYYRPEELRSRINQVFPRGSNIPIQDLLRGLVDIDVSLSYGATELTADNWRVLEYVVSHVAERTDFGELTNNLSPLEQRVMKLAYGYSSYADLSPSERAELRNLGKLGRGLVRYDASLKLFHTVYSELAEYVGRK